MGSKRINIKSLIIGVVVFGLGALGGMWWDVHQGMSNELYEFLTSFDLSGVGGWVSDLQWKKTPEGQEQIVAGCTENLEAMLKVVEDNFLGSVSWTEIETDAKEAGEEEIGFGNYDGKWRWEVNEPYFGYPVGGEFSYAVEGENYEAALTKYEKTIKSFEGMGFVVSEANNIPKYRYPEGNLARKVGLTKDNLAFLTGIFESEFVTDGKEINLVGGESSVGQKAIEFKVYCMDVEGFDKEEAYQQYREVTDLPNESVVEFNQEIGSNTTDIYRFMVTYPGSSGWEVVSEYWYVGGDEWVKLNEVEPGLWCDRYEGLRLGADKPVVCFDREKRLFRMSQ